MKYLERYIEESHRFYIQPGDATLYDFYMHKDGPDSYTFAPANSTIMIPQRIDYFELVEYLEGNDEDMESLESIADKYNCNIHTVKACCIAIMYNKRMINEDGIRKQD